MTTAKDPPILGLGNDIVEIERIRKSVKTYGTRFLSRIFTAEEQSYCSKYKDPIPHFAARFSAKEAVAKALGTGLGKHVSWQDIEILNDATGKPVVYFSNQLLKKTQGTVMLVSLSHCKLHASAVAIWVKSK